MSAEPLLPDTAELRRRFAFCPELNLLYDRRHGLEHRLNETAATFVSCTFSSPEPASAVARHLGVTQVAVPVHHVDGERARSPARRRQLLGTRPSPALGLRYYHAILEAHAVSCGSGGPPPAASTANPSPPSPSPTGSSPN